MSPPSNQPLNQTGFKMRQAVGLLGFDALARLLCWLTLSVFGVTYAQTMSGGTLGSGGTGGTGGYCNPALQNCNTNTNGSCNPLIQSCTTPVKECTANSCFANEVEKEKFEKANNCKFPNDTPLCGTAKIDKATQCCGKDAQTGKPSVRDRLMTQLNPDFKWDDYVKQCPAMRQREGGPDALWNQCVVGQRHDPNDDDWPVIVVQPNLLNSNARPYCVDGCSTPNQIVSYAVTAGIFLVKDKDNPTGFPGASFIGGCSAHDVCYQTCSQNTQTDCDNRLLANNLANCENIPANHKTPNIIGVGISTRGICVGAATAMHAGLWAGGKAAFSRRRQQYCQCC
jgi:hypothetical protein